MANFVPSALVAGQGIFAENMQKPEWRLPDFACLKVAKYGEIMFPNFSQLKTREDRSVTISFPVRQAATNGTARAHDHTGAVGDSAIKTPSLATLSETFSISKKQAGNNVLSWANMYAASLRNAILNILSRGDAWLAAALIADKTQVNVGGGKGEWNGTDFIMEIPAAEANYFFQNAEECLMQNLYTGRLTAILDNKAWSLRQRLSAQGSANSTNFGFQFDNIDAVRTTRTLLGTSYDGSGIFFETGQVAVIPWIPVENRIPLDEKGVLEYNGAYGQIPVPEIGLNFAIHAYSARANRTAVGGYTQDLATEFEVSIDLAYQSAPLGTVRGSNDSVVYAVGQKITD